MKKTLYLILMIIATSCRQEKDNSDSLKEFQFIHKGKITWKEGYLTAFVKSDSVKPGETYLAKVFLANRHNVYDADSIEPIIRYHYKDSISWKNLYSHGTLAKVVNDTAYIKFVVNDGGFKAGTSDRQDWRATIQIPTANGDTSFYLTHELIIKK